MVNGKKVFLWGGVHAYVENGRLVKIEDEGFRGEKTFEEITLENGVLKVKTVSGVEYEYDINNKMLRVLKPFKYEGPSSDFFKVTNALDPLATILANLKQVGRVSAKILLYHPMHAIYVPDHGDSGYTLEEVKGMNENELNGLVWDILFSISGEDSNDYGVKVYLKNYSGLSKKVKIVFEKPDKLIVLYRKKSNDWILVEGDSVEVTLEDGKSKRVEFFVLSFLDKTRPERLKVSVIDEDTGEVVASEETVVYSI